MKKEYAKPFIVFESFTLSTHIAGDCEITTNLSAQGQCGYETRQGIVFADATMGCTYTSVITGEGTDIMYNQICYHVPIETKNLFNS